MDEDSIFDWDDMFDGGIFAPKPRRARVDFSTMTYKNQYSFESLTDTWVTKGGEKVKPEDMDDSHLTNTIYMVENICESEGWDPNNYPIYKILCAETRLRQRKSRWPGCLVTRYVMLSRKGKKNSAECAPKRKRGKKAR